MAVRNLDRIFRPRSVAVVGASPRAGTVSNAVLRNLNGGGFPGSIYPINPRHQTIEGLACYAGVDNTPDVPDLAVICTPAPTVPAIVNQCGARGIRGLIVVSAGFRETGRDGAALEEAVRAEALRYPGMRIIGPNCLGVLAPHAGLNASFAADMPHKGHVAFISQSGALCTSVLDWAMQEEIGFSYFVSLGNMLDVAVDDLIDYCALDPRTSAIVLYVESLTNARQFLSAARAFTREKPIIAYKAGRFAESAKAAASHTGAMAGVDAVYEAAFARAGIVRVLESNDLFDCAELLARQKLPRGPRLAIVTNAGGPGVMATDALLTRRGVLAQLSEQTLQKLDGELPAAWSRGNPVDVLGDATSERFARGVEIVLADDGVDGVLAILSPQAMTDPTGAARSLIEVAQRARKPVLTSWMGGRRMRDAVAAFNAAGIPTYESPEKAVGAFMYLVTYSRNRQVLYETPREVPVEFPLNRERLRGVWDAVRSEERDLLTESESKTILKAYEVPVVETRVARSADEAARLAQGFGYPVALKVFSPQITHKTDVGGVELNLVDEHQVRAAYEGIVCRARERRPDATVEGVTVQRMVSAPGGVELIIGAKRDPVFGMVLLVGAGGTAAELFQDRALELPPLNERLARRALESLRSWPLLRGYRGRPAVNIDRLIEVLIRFSYLVADSPALLELDVNPLLVTPDQVIALDARVVVDRAALMQEGRPYSHLSIRPYPEEYTRHATLKDGTPVLLRAIRPEDEPMWHALLASCSPESLRLRFRHMFKATTHEMATRFCFIDYDRELAIVVERQEDGERRLLGVGRLIADADHREAEYAVLVGDPWQDMGLGSMLTDYCLEICRGWKIERVVAETAPDNPRMITIFERRGFDVRYDTPAGVVRVRKLLE
jgi:acetyltransferase